MNDLRFPSGFLWGVSTSAHQFEGGNLHNQWAAWERRGGIRSGHACAEACNWWREAEADLDLCRELGLNAIRISIDWARLEPVEGQWSHSAMARYRAILCAAVERGMRPFVTLHHFTHPQWLEEAGGFTVMSAARKFAAFSERVVAGLGECCRDWVTFNEPNVYAGFSPLPDTLKCYRGKEVPYLPRGCIILVLNLTYAIERRDVHDFRRNVRFAGAEIS